MQRCRRRQRPRRHNWRNRWSSLYYAIPSSTLSIPKMAPASTGPPLPFHKTFAASAIAACTAEIMTLPLGECMGRGQLANSRRRSLGSLPLRRLGWNRPPLTPCAVDTAKVKLQLQPKGGVLKYKCASVWGGARGCRGERWCLQKLTLHTIGLPLTAPPPLPDTSAGDCWAHS